MSSGAEKWYDVETVYHLNYIVTIVPFWAKRKTTPAWIVKEIIIVAEIRNVKKNIIYINHSAKG